MAVKFHVFANEQFVQTIEANSKLHTLQNYVSSLDGNSTPHYGYRRGGDHYPNYDGWYTMRSLLPIPSDSVPPNIRVLHLLMDL